MSCKLQVGRGGSLVIAHVSRPKLISHQAQGILSNPTNQELAYWVIEWLLIAYPYLQ